MAAGNSRVSRALRNAEFPMRAPTVPIGVEPPEAPSKVGTDFDTDWARRMPARVARLAIHELVVEPAVRLVARPKVHGVDRLDRLEGPAVFAPNHHSHLDTPLLLRTIPEPWRHKAVVAAASDYFFTSRVTGAASAIVLNAVPIERQRINRSSAAAVADLVLEGWSLVIFPEGGRSPDGWGQEFRGGAAYVALRCGVPLVPVHIDGTNRVLPKGTRRPHPQQVTVTFGEPMRPDEGESARRLSARLERAVAALGDETATDWWTARKRAHAGTSPSLRGPETTSWRRAWAVGAAEDARGERRRRRWPPI
ncbi:MAG: lysophospholipid acyltransferase family protein [Actinomycetota bacterium]|nr:lysophospholipid acyltransferase family protein [Actinomycetota bacterium]